MHEYSIILEATDVEPEIRPTATKAEFSQNLEVALNKAVSRMSERIKIFQEDAWEIVSHQLTWFDQYLVISFLLRRPK